MKVKLKYISLLVITFLMVKCESATEPIKPILKHPYITLKVGDIHQYKSDISNTYFQWEVVDTSKRSDGLKVFSIEESILLPTGLWKGTNNYYLSDEYFIRTQLNRVDSSDNKSENPFLEHLIAKIYPNEGDYFQTNNGIPDAEKFFMSINIVDSLETFAKTFITIAKYRGIFVDTTDNKWYAYYAQGFGHIGTIISNQMGFDEIYITYIKSDTSEIGEYIPFISNNIAKLDKSKSVISYLFPTTNIRRQNK